MIMPHTQSFTLANKKYWERFVHEEYHAQEHLLVDPAWEYPDSIDAEDHVGTE